MRLGSRHPAHPRWYLGVLQRAYYNARHYEKAIELRQRSDAPNRLHLESLAASHAQLGQTERVQVAAEKLLEIKPDHTTAEFIANARRPDRTFVQGLRQARLPGS